MTQKNVPQLNAQGLYVGATVADLCAIDGETWLVPGGAVDAPFPRALGRYECARYAADKGAAPWDYLPDYSGAIVYSVARGERIDVPAGWTLAEAGGTLQAPDRPSETPDAATVEDLKAALQIAATAKRKAVESGGITLNGVRVATAIEDQNRITSVIANADAAGLAVVDFKAASGWVTLTLPELRAIAVAIALHVQGCYSAERAHSLAVDALTTLDALRAYDLSPGWPA